MARLPPTATNHETLRAASTGRCKARRPSRPGLPSYVADSSKGTPQQQPPRPAAGGPPSRAAPPPAQPAHATSSASPHALAQATHVLRREWDCPTLNRTGSVSQPRRTRAPLCQPSRREASPRQPPQLPETSRTTASNQPGQVGSPTSRSQRTRTERQAAPAEGCGGRRTSKPRTPERSMRTRSPAPHRQLGLPSPTQASRSPPRIRPTPAWSRL